MPSPSATAKLVNDMLAGNSSLAGSDGVQIGSSATSKVGFYGATPADQPATIADASGGETVDAEARAAINAVLAALKELGLVASA